MKEKSKSKYHNHNNNIGGWQPCVFAANASDHSSAGRVLAEFHDSGRMQCASEPHLRSRQHRSWLVCAVWDFHRQLQHKIGAGAPILNNSDSNTAVGTAGLLLNTAGTGNSALGTTAMVNNDTGSNNTALAIWPFKIASAISIPC